MSEISKAYEPQSVEDKWYQFWLDRKFFVADAKSPKPAYSIVIPPPNVTGVLTLGHVLNNTIQDILARKARMDGKEVLWLPGTDHAGIATQTVVERALKKEGKIKHRDDLGREKFLEEVWKWKNEKGGIIIQQLKKLGASCDWTRERFTMDPEYSRCVQRVFVDLYKKGLIYRGKRMVNWCPASLTALSDEEVVMKEQKGFLYYFKVEVVGSATVPVADSGVAPESSLRTGIPSGGTPNGADETSALPEEKIFLTIATTRPETISGDTAVAVNPKDPRYAHLIGKHVVRPLPVELPREQKLIPIIGDEHVDFEFGTGVLKVTPAHDKADFEIGARHKLAAIEVIAANGQMNDAAGADLRGLDRFKARKVAVEKLTELGALEKEEPYTNNVGYSERADVPIEPRLSEQWFLKYPSVEKARECVELGSATVPVADSGVAPESSSRAGIPSGGTPNGADETSALPKMQFHPQRWAKVYDHWMGGLQDWCVSRQLWWGHRIPVWQGTFSFEKDKRPVNLGPVLVQAMFYPNKELEYSLSGSETEKTHFRGVPVPQGGAANIIAATASESEARELEKLGFTQDPDVLDTWFSSWLWPFATMGWPEQTDTLKKFYPTTDLVTGPDIIFFWVARMIMAGYEYMGDPKFGLSDAMPFQNVYFTGIIRDKQGRKMSKSLGNSPDPLDLIAKFGADALRFGVMRAAPLGQDILFDEQNVELGRNFCNKLWNACRFRQMQGCEVQGEIEPTLLSSDDKWILLKLDAAIREVTIALNEYKFSDATAALYRFFWSEYCDWYVEASKAVFFSGSRRESAQTSESGAESQSGLTSAATNPRAANTLAVIDFVLSHTLRLFHPFLPFITEELWHGMGYATDMPENQGGKTIMFAPWPLPLDDDFKGHYGLDDCYLHIAGAKYELVSQGRNLRREANISAAKKIKYVLKPVNYLPPHDIEVIRLLLNAEAVEVNENYSPAKGTLTARTELGELFLPLEGLRSAEELAAEKTRVTKELEKIEAEISKVEQKLANPSFTQKVPPQVLQEHQQRLAEWQAKREQVKAALEALS
jgi:valyl-tRNA synthetase